MELSSTHRRTSLPMVKTGHARALGVTGSRRVRRCEALTSIGNCHHQVSSVRVGSGAP